MEKKQKPAAPTSQKEFDEAVASIAYSFLEIRSCMKCKWPVISGYCCTFCGDTNPSEYD